MIDIMILVFFVISMDYFFINVYFDEGDQHFK